MQSSVWFGRWNNLRNTDIQVAVEVNRENFQGLGPLIISLNHKLHCETSKAALPCIASCPYVL